jgi:Uma2 family endonuclease
VSATRERPRGRPATRADLDALPPHLRGEIIDGALYVQPRPRAIHANVEASILEAVRGPYQHGRGGAGGWWVLPEPGIEVPGATEFVPDVAAWRRDRLPALPGDRAIDVVPDWVCEVLSPSTRGSDLVTKRRFYARIGVAWLWYVDVEARSVSVCRLEAGTWRELAVHGDDERARLEPFAEVELDLGSWWAESP